MTILTAATILLAAAISGVIVRTVHSDSLWHPSGAMVAAIAGPLLLVCGLAYWGFGPLVRQRRQVEQVLERTAGIKSWGIEPAADAGERKKRRDADSRKFQFKVAATVALAASAISMHTLYPSQPAWESAAMFYFGMITWELAFSRKSRRECFAHASFWALLFMTSFGGDVMPSESIWRIVTPLIGLAAITFIVWKTADSIPMQSRDSVMEAYRKADYSLAMERAKKMDPAFTDQHDHYSLRALVAYRNQELDDAEILVRKALAMQWDSRKASALLSLLSLILLEKGQFGYSASALEGAAELDRLNGSVARIRTLLLLRQGLEPELALDFSQKALVCDEHEMAQALAVRAWALAENGQETEAREAIDFALSLPMAKSKPEFAEMSYHAGEALLNFSNQMSAERHLIRAAEADPDGLFGAHALETLKHYRRLA